MVTLLCIHVQAAPAPRSSPPQPLQCAEPQVQRRRQRQSASQQRTAQDNGSTARATATAHVVLQQTSIKNGFKQVRPAGH
jgi:hypothetical protein